MTELTTNKVKKPRLLARIIYLSILLVLIIGGLAYYKLGVQIPKLIAQGQVVPPPTKVAVALSKSDVWNKQFKTIGSLVAVHGIEVTSEVAGVIKSIDFQSGQKIERGALLLSLSDETEKATLASAQASYKSANSQYQRSLKLKSKKFVTDNDLDLQRSSVAVAKAQIESAQAALNKMNIKAPFSGLLGIRRVDEGEYISPGTQLVTLQAVEELYLDFALPERNFNVLKTGQNLLFNVRSYPDEVFEGRIQAWDPILDENTRTVAVRATVDNTDHRLAPGMFAEINLQSTNKIDVVTVPEIAIFYTIYGEAVYVLEKSQEQEEYILATRQVKVLYRDNGVAGIAQGLEPGIQVVTAGQLKLYPSLKVVVTADAPAFGQAQVEQKKTEHSKSLTN